MEERHLSLGEVARLLDKSERTIRRWIKSGKLKAYKPGRDYLIPESAINELMEGSEVSPKAAFPLQLELGVAGEADEAAGSDMEGFTAAVVHAIDTMIGLRVIAREYLLEWAEDLNQRRETGGAGGVSVQQDIPVIAGSLQDQFIGSFAVIERAARIEGRPAPHQWPENIKEVVYEAGARVQAAVEVAQRIDEEFSVGAMPEDLTNDPAWSEALEEARAPR